MKRTFLKVLPFAAALLLATSCSKDDNNSTDEIVNGGEQIETVTKTVKTLTIKGKVKQSISKVTTNSEGTALAFEANDVFTFGQAGDAVYGTITIQDANGNYTATVNYTDETALFNTTFTAIHGENPSKISEGYSTLAAAVQHACYETAFTISYTNDKYSLASAESSDIVINLKSAFIKALSAEKTTIGVEEITVEADQYYVVPVGKAMGNSSNTTLAGRIYSIGSAVPKNCLPGVFSVSSNRKVYFSKGNLQYNTTSSQYQFSNNQWDCIGYAKDADGKTCNEKCTGTFDLFSWGSGANPTNTSTNYSTFDDWGNYVSKNDGDGWFTLSREEWDYLINQREGNRFSYATIHEISGFIILPDNWNGTYNFSAINGDCETENVISDNDWETLEAEGVVFLPCAGRRDLRSGTYVGYVNVAGHYQTSDERSSSECVIIAFGSKSGIGTAGGSGRWKGASGYSVRLVRDL